MNPLRWLRERRSTAVNPELDDWRRRWQAAAATPQPDAPASLLTDLNRLGLPEEEIEVEREMLEGLEHLARLRAVISSQGLPIVETGHRVVGAETCHFSAPVSMPDDPAQPSGRLIFTGLRAIFAGGARALTLPWHAVADVIRQERDVILVRHDREVFHRFRCNVFADALCAGVLAETLAKAMRSGARSRQSR